MCVCAVCSVKETAFKLKKFLILQHLEKRDFFIYLLSSFFFLLHFSLLITKHRIQLALQLQSVIDFRKK